jgi:hypothetical protein
LGVRIDATDGKLLEKNDFVISCSFDHSKATNHSHDSLGFYLTLVIKSFHHLGTNNWRLIRLYLSILKVLTILLFNLFNPANDKASPFGWHDVDGL